LSALDVLTGVPLERRIYLDLDDVLAETTVRIVTELNQRFDRSVRFADLSSFDLGQCFSFDETQRKLAMECVHEEPFLTSLAVRRGARPLLQRWTEAGYHLAVITGRPPDTRPISRSWLEQRRVPHHSFHCVDKYGRYGESAGDLSLESLRELPFVLAVEDSFEMACFLARHGTRRVLLLDRPWNREKIPTELAAERRLVRARGWTDVARLAAEAFDER